jgi:hypothetical protein
MGLVIFLAATVQAESENRSLPGVPVVDAAQVKRAGTGRIKKLGRCHLVPMIEDAPPPPREAGAYVFGLSEDAFIYLDRFEHRVVRGVTATVTVVQKPEHGVLEDDGGGSYSYYPNAGYLGKDKAIFGVEYAGETFQIIYFFRSIEGGTDGMEGKYCPKGASFWKISLRSTAIGYS